MCNKLLLTISLNEGIFFKFIITFARTFQCEASPLVNPDFSQKKQNRSENNKIIQFSNKMSKTFVNLHERYESFRPSFDEAVQIFSQSENVQNPLVSRESVGYFDS